jgi:hypothetical protein
MVSAPGSRAKSTHHSDMALKSWARTKDRSARTAPGRLAAARAVLAEVEAKARLADASALADDGAA